MEMDDLMSLGKLTPLSAAVGHIDPTAYLGSYLYRLGQGLYFYLTRFGADGDIRGPFLTGLFCAPDDGGVMRATAMKIDEDPGTRLAPPAGFFPPEVVLEYGCIASRLKNMHPKTFQESASYRIASDGLFVHRTIETERYTVYFRSPENDAREAPYAILYKY